MTAGDAALWTLIRTIAAGDAAAAQALLEATPALARARVIHGATRAAPTPCFLDELRHVVYRGDTALHIAAAAYRRELVRSLCSKGADVAAANRRGQQPLHYAVDGMPGSCTWDPSAQVATVVALLDAGADPNATDTGAVTPLHRAVRNRCAAAVRALLDGGADARRPNGSGSTPLMLATRTTGRGGSGAPEARAEAEEIIRLLERAAAAPRRR
jgi:hypothetical protein